METFQGTSRDVFEPLFGTKTGWNLKFEFDNFEFFCKICSNYPSFMCVNLDSSGLVLIVEMEGTQLNGKDQPIMPWFKAMITNFEKFPK